MILCTEDSNKSADISEGTIHIRRCFRFYAKPYDENNEGKHSRCIYYGKKRSRVKVRGNFEMT